MDVAVLWDICSTRSAVDPIGPDARVALHPTDLHSVTPWQARQTLGRMQVDAFGVPVDLWVDMVGTAGISARGAAHSSFDDMTVAAGIMEASLGSTPVSVDEDTSQGAYARLRLVGTGYLALTLRAVVQLLSRVEPTLPQRVEEILAELPALAPPKPARRSTSRSPTSSCAPRDATAWTTSRRRSRDVRRSSPRATCTRARSTRGSPRRC
jgi:hypothetical protein